MKIYVYVKASYPDGPVYYIDAFMYDLRTLQPQPGPIIAEWIAKYSKYKDFKIEFRKGTR